MNHANNADSDLNCSFLSLESTTQFSSKIDVKNKNERQNRICVCINLLIEFLCEIVIARPHSI